MFSVRKYYRTKSNCTDCDVALVEGENNKPYNENRCSECHRVRQRNYLARRATTPEGQAEREQKRITTAEWIKNNPRRFRMLMQEWRANNKERVAKHSREWRERNKERLAEYDRNRRKKKENI